MRHLVAWRLSQLRLLALDFDSGQDYRVVRLSLASGSMPSTEPA